MPKAALAVKPSETTSVQAFSLPSSYSLVTADQMINDCFGMDLSHERLAHQILNSRTMFHALLYLPSQYTALMSRQARCRDIHVYGQQKMVHYLLSGEAVKDEEELGQDARDTIEQLRIEFVEVGHQFMDWEAATLTQYRETLGVLQDKAQSWQLTVVDVIEHGVAMLSDAGVHTLRGPVITTLQEWLLDFAVSVPRYSKSVIGFEYEHDTIVESCMVALFHDGLIEPLSHNQLKQMRPRMKQLDEMLLAAFTDMGGVNTEGNEIIKQYHRQMNEYKHQVDAIVERVSKSLFEYYRHYASDRGLVSDTSLEASALGVEPDVSESYRRLRGFAGG